MQVSQVIVFNISSFKTDEIIIMICFHIDSFALDTRVSVLSNSDHWFCSINGYKPCVIFLVILS